MIVEGMDGVLRSIMRRQSFETLTPESLGELLHELVEMEQLAKNVKPMLAHQNALRVQKLFMQETGAVKTQTAALMQAVRTHPEAVAHAQKEKSGLAAALDFLLIPLGAIGIVVVGMIGLPEGIPAGSYVPAYGGADWRTIIHNAMGVNGMLFLQFNFWVMIAAGVLRSVKTVSGSLLKTLVAIPVIAGGWVLFASMLFNHFLITVFLLMGFTFWASENKKGQAGVRGMAERFVPAQSLDFPVGFTRGNGRPADIAGRQDYPAQIMAKYRESVILGAAARRGYFAKGDHFRFVRSQGGPDPRGSDDHGFHDHPDPGRGCRTSIRQPGICCPDPGIGKPPLAEI